MTIFCKLHKTPSYIVKNICKHSYQVERYFLIDSCDFTYGGSEFVLSSCYIDWIRIVVNWFLFCPISSDFGTLWIGRTSRIGICHLLQCSICTWIMLLEIFHFILWFGASGSTQRVRNQLEKIVFFQLWGANTSTGWYQIYFFSVFITLRHPHCLWNPKRLFSTPLPC